MFVIGNSISVSAKKIKVVLFFTIFAAITVSCSRTESGSSGVVEMHPFEEKIPYFDRDHIPIEPGNFFSELEGRSPILDLLYRYLQYSESDASETLEIQIGSENFFDVTSVDQNRIVVLDPRRNHLFEYDLNTHNSYTIAEFGRGPGDIHLPQEMVRKDEHVFIVTRDRYISRFNCQSIPCEFEEAVSLNYTPVSITFTDERRAVLGYPDNSGGRNITANFVEGFQPVRLIDLADGQERAQFGKVYNTGEGWFSLQQLAMSGKIRYSPEEHVFILIFLRFPVVYVYDADSMELTDSYKISEFVLGKQSYWPDTGRIRSFMEDNTLVRSSNVYEGNLLLIETETRRNRRRVDGEYLYDISFEFQVVDLAAKSSYYLGGYENVGVSIGGGKSIKITQNGLLVYDNEEDMMSWISI